MPCRTDFQDVAVCHRLIFWRSVDFFSYKICPLRISLYCLLTYIVKNWYSKIKPFIFTIQRRLDCLFQNTRLPLKGSLPYSFYSFLYPIMDRACTSVWFISLQNGLCCGFIIPQPAYHLHWKCSKFFWSTKIELKICGSNLVWIRVFSKTNNI